MYRLVLVITFIIAGMTGSEISGEPATIHSAEPTLPDQFSMPHRKSTLLRSGWR
jgi:hypothetical protein